VYYQPSSGRPSSPVNIPRSFHLTSTNPGDYLPEPGLVSAVNTALLLGQPLLLTGEPGTGKTQLASSLAYQLGYPAPMRFDCKSTSQARDVLYSYDSLGRFKAQQSSGSERNDDPVRFIHYSALGRAIVFANDPATVEHLIPPSLQHPGKTRSLILIDEIDKAPRDFPNDLLTELEELRFDIPELSATVSAAEDPPVVIITSNSERDLPDAFLRRCAYYDIPFPKMDAIKQILAARLRAMEGDDDAFISTAVELFERLRAANLSKKPATAELIGWMIALRRKFPDLKNPLEDRRGALGTAGALAKTAEDLKTVQSIMLNWAER
jgi:MoxR-like ATPase